MVTMARWQIVLAASYWLILMISSYLGSGITFYLVAFPAIAFGVWQVLGYVREELGYAHELPSEAFARAARHASVAELRLEMAALDPAPHNWVESDWEWVGNREPYATEERCTQCRARVNPRDHRAKSQPCWVHPNYQPTREERECALDVRMCETRYDSMMQEVETGERGESCNCWQAVFKDPVTQ